MIKKKFLKIFALFLCVIFAGGIYASLGGRDNVLAIETSAAEAKYNVTNEYKSSKFYSNLTSVSLSGDGARDVLAIAMSQLGYHEGDSERDFNGESKTGSRDFVEYNVLYGKLDNGQGNGLSYGYYWCASFVNWCLRQAGIPESATAGAEVSCHRWFSDCKDAGIYKSKSGYIPQLGDIIFFKDKGSAVDSTHVGLVRYSDGNYVYTVEGNTSNGSEYSSNGEYVALKSHALSSSYIVGYARPKYGEMRTSRRVDYSGAFFSTGDYISKKEINVFSDNTLKTALGKKIPAFTVFKAVKLEDGCMQIKLGDIEGYVSSDISAMQITAAENVYMISYVNDDGAQMYMPQYCLSGQEKKLYANIPFRENHGFVGWSVSGADGAVLSPGDKIPCNGDVTLKAVWDPNTYTVSFNNADGTVFYQTSGYYGAKYEIPTPPTAPEGFVFYGWGAELDGKIKGNATYTAEFISEEELQDALASESESEPKPKDSLLSGCASSVSGTAVAVVATLSCLTLILKKKKQ